MSIRLMNAILDDGTITDPTETLLLLALADHANDDGVCWPSIDRLAQRARVSERQAQRLIGKLIDDGRIVADRRGGRNRSTIYRLIVKGDMGVTVSTQKGDIGDTKRVTSATKRVTPMTQKGDTHVTPIPNQPSIESPREPKIGGVGENCARNGGGEEKTDAAQEPDAAAVELAEEVIAAWDAARWPLTDKLRKCLVNAERGYSRGELLAVIGIMREQRTEIPYPGGYLKRVLQQRMSAIVDRAPVSAERWQNIADETADHRQPSPRPEPPADPTAAAVLARLAESLGNPDVSNWRVAVDGERVTVWTHQADVMQRAQPRLERLLAQDLARPVTLAFVGPA